MVHKRLERHIVREDGLRALGADATVRPASVRGGRVEFRQQETRLGSAGITHDEPREREAVRDEIL